jgi:hypothetical protein
MIASRIDTSVFSFSPWVMQMKWSSHIRKFSQIWLPQKCENQNFKHPSHFFAT